MRDVGAVCVVLLVCTAPVFAATTVAGGVNGDSGTESVEKSGVVGSNSNGATSADANVENQTQRPDPQEDVLGWENGYWHNESIAVNQSDGLSEAEREAYVNRAMARVEFIRNQEFKRPVEVNSLRRGQYQELIGSQIESQYTQSQRAWENQIWEALFAVGEQSDAARQQTQLYQQRVAGFYLPGRDKIYVIADDSLVIDNATLVHELTHALQDQQVGLASSQFEAETMDGQRANDGLTEGEASYVEQRYVQRCGAEWECVEMPGPPREETPYGGGSLPDFNLAMQVSLIQPYSDGPAYVASKVDSDGWQSVQQEYRNPPNASEQIIDPIERNDASTPLRLGEQAQNGWKLYGQKGENGSETVGETGIYTMFWYQGRADDNPIIRWQTFENPELGEYDTFNYTSVPSDGWANDRLWPYRNGDKRGYVWRTAWDTNRDATEFQRAYRDLLRGQNATRTGSGAWVIENGEFADAFRIVRDGRTVTIVNAPTEGDLADIRPGVTNTSSVR
ncbi:Hvo_1808 family surface protein [Haladaptatus cibarius]|uniref:Hvo_1808 family surface protein n=1 Tax=Haladaptatus cibarius TaxID=453847 RepID=UPI0006795E85|nr:Hvo_1808 family surface protein [Haladaptatus cibarius]